MDNLPLQVGVIHHIEVDQPQSPYARSRKVERQRRSKTARADAQHARRFQLLLPLHAHLGHDQMARVAEDFLLAEGYRNFRCGGHKVLEQNLNCRAFESKQIVIPSEARDLGSCSRNHLARDYRQKPRSLASLGMTKSGMRDDDDKEATYLPSRRRWKAQWKC